MMSEPDPTSESATASSDHPIADIFRALKHGVGRERVTDQNVEALIAMAKEKGEAQLEFLLREWRSDCGDDRDAPILPHINTPPR
jgi:hypothetical protein